MIFSDNLLLSAIFFGAFIYSVILHEIAHGWVALREGDWTAKLDGRLTLNPIPHIDIFGTIILPIALTFFGSPVVFGWAKPVPVNWNNLRRGEKSYVMVALAGIVVNLSIAIIGSLAIRIAVETSPGSLLVYLLYYLVATNVLLALFNLMPIPPLDGSRVLRAFLPMQYKHMLDQIEPYGFIVLFLFLMTFQGALWGLVQAVVNVLLTGVTL